MFLTAVSRVLGAQGDLFEKMNVWFFRVMDGSEDDANGACSVVLVVVDTFDCGYACSKRR